MERESGVSERRKFVRIDAAFVVYYTAITTLPSKSDASQTRNISVGGVLFITNKKFPTGTMLRIRIRLPDSFRYVSADVKVVDSKERVKNLMYETRAKFIGIKKEHKDAIKKMVEYHTQGRKEGLEDEANEK